MSGPNVKLSKIYRVSNTCVLLTPKDGEPLNFATINSTPPAHRELVQKNGLIAKLWLSVNAEKSSNRTLLQQIQSGKGTFSLWKETLEQCGLVGKGAALTPTKATEAVWPIQSGGDFAERLHFMTARHKSTEVETSSYCAPITFLQTFNPQVNGMCVQLGVVWMPLYPYDLVTWSEKQRKMGTPIPRLYLTHLVKHLTSAMQVWRKIIMSLEGKVSLRGCPETLEMEDVFVNEVDGEPTFIVSSSLLCNATKLATLANVSDDNYRLLCYYPYIAPEQVQSHRVPINSPKFDVWAMGMIVYNVACGTPSLKSQIQRLNDRKGKDLPFNHPRARPDLIVQQIRAYFDQANYPGDLISLVALMLSLDYRSRPSLLSLEKMMVELDRENPILRFPFALGSYELLRLPQVSQVELNPVARRYITTDTCCLCHDQRNKAKNCGYKNGGEVEHIAAITSPSWTGDELLPGMIRPVQHMVYLYPLIPPLEKKERRRLTSVALGAKTESNTGVRASGFHSPADVMDCGQLFQLFGGFAVFSNTSTFSVTDVKKTQVALKDVLVPFPTNGLRKDEQTLSIGTLQFSAALPWPSECTKILNKKGRIVRQVPFTFVGTDHDVKWFAWIIPGETFKLSSGESFCPSQDGAFVFFFRESLEPCELDRYFCLTSVRGMTARDAVTCTTQPDKVFMRHLGMDDRHGSMWTSVASFSHVGNSQSLTDSGAASSGTSPNRRRSESSRRRRNTNNISLIDMPESRGIVENDAVVAPPRRQTFPSVEAGSAAVASKKNQRPRSRGTSQIVATAIPTPTTDMTSVKRPLPMSAQPVNTIKSNAVPTLAKLAKLERRPSDDVVMVSPSVLSISMGGNNTSQLSLGTASRLPALTDAANVPAIQTFGSWCKPSVVEAVFQSLTFWVPSTGEHGLLQPPITLNDSTRLLLKAPSNAMYMSFLSNQVPLFNRNHTNYYNLTANSQWLFPHHGFVFYNENEQVVGVLRLYCAVNYRPKKDEFRITAKPLPPIAGTELSPELLYASYLTDMTSSNAKGGGNRDLLSGDLLHSFSHSNTQLLKREALTFSSAQKLQGDLTPREGENVYSEGGNTNSRKTSGSTTEEKNMCWVGFETASCSIVYANALQTVWYPFRV